MSNVKKILFIVTTSDEETLRAGLLNATNLMANDVPVKMFVSQKACHFFTKKAWDASPDGDVSLKGRMGQAFTLGLDTIVCRTAVANYKMTAEDFVDKVDATKGWGDIVDEQTDPDVKVLWIA